MFDSDSDYGQAQLFGLAVLHLVLFLPIYGAFLGWRLFGNGIAPSKAAR